MLNRQSRLWEANTKKSSNLSTCWITSQNSAKKSQIPEDHTIRRCCQFAIYLFSQFWSNSAFSPNLRVGSHPTGQSEPLPWEFPLILILTSDINAGHQIQIPTTLLSLPSAQPGLFSQPQVSFSPFCLPSHTTTSSTSSAQCYWSKKNHPLNRLPVCYSSDLESFILDLWTWTHVSDGYEH